MTYEPEDFGPLTLSHGAHEDPKDGMCILEMISFLAGEDWSDEPECVSPVIAEFCQTLNDATDDAGRDRLLAYVPRIINTASPEHDLERVRYLTWAALRILAPLTLDACGLEEDAERLRDPDNCLDKASSIARWAAYGADRLTFVYRPDFKHGQSVASATDIVAAQAHVAANGLMWAEEFAENHGGFDDCGLLAEGIDEIAADVSHVVYNSAMALEWCNDRQKHTDTVFEILDGLLKIGSPGDGLTDENLARVEPLRELVGQ